MASKGSNMAEKNGRGESVYGIACKKQNERSSRDGRVALPDTVLSYPPLSTRLHFPTSHLL